METTAKRSKTRSLTEIALMAALTCVLGPLSIPIGPIPVSLTPFAVFLTVYLLGARKGTAAFCVYFLIGLVGAPVFSGFTGGVQKVAGPTGGYLFSFILMAFIAGLFIEHFKNPVIQFIGCFLALCLSYAIGTAWLAWQGHMTMQAAFAAAVVPFVPFDIVKIVLAIIVGKVLRKALIGAHVLPAEY